MFKKLTELQAKLQDELEALADELQTVQAILAEPEPSTFDELQAAKRITAAKSADHLEGTQTAEAIIKTIDKERAEAAKQLSGIAKQKSDARQKHAMKQAQLIAIENELASIDWKLKEAMQEEAKTLLQAKKEAYRAAAVALLNALIDIDALNAIIADAPNESPAKLVLQLKPLPKASLDNADEVEPWQLQEYGEKLLFTTETAFPAVNSRYQALLEDIKGTLYAQ